MRRVVRQAKLAQHSQRLRREGFVQFHNIEIGNAQANARQ